jgi:hypothetical protein
VTVSGTIYLVDTDVLEHIRFRADSKKIYAGLISMSKNGGAKTIRQVFGELKKHKETYSVLATHEKCLCITADLQFCLEVRGKLELVRQEAGHLWEPLGAFGREKS